MAGAAAREEPDGKWSSRERAFVLGAVVVALVLRLLHWKSMAPYPWFDFLGLDAKYYDEWAQRLLAEGWIGKDPYFMGPLYPHLLAVIYAIAGHSLDAVRAVQIVMSAGTVALMHVFVRPYGGPRLAGVASGMAAVYGPFVYYSTSILYPTLTVLLTVLLLHALLRAAERESRAWTIAAGATMGVFALGRGNILLFAPFAFAWLLCAWGRPFAPRWSPAPGGIRAGVTLAAATVACILPATFHNLLTGDPTLLTTNGGLNLYIGNGPMARGGHETPVLYVPRPDGTVETIVADLPKDNECRTEAERATGRSMKYTEVSAFFTKETVDYVKSHPGHFFRLLTMKFTHFWSAYEIPQIEHFDYFRRYSLPLKGPVLSYGILVPLAFAGMAFAWRRRGRFALPYLFTVAYCGAVVLFFVLARYRMPVVPPLLLFAALAIVEIHDAVRARRWRPVGVAAAGILLAGVAVRANPYGVDEKSGIAQILYRHGIVSDSQRDWEGAVGHYRDALALKEDNAKCHLNLGTDLARLGRIDEAMEHMLRAEELDPLYSRAPYNRGLLLEQVGRDDDALAAFRKAVGIEPRYLLARASLADRLLVAGDRAAAEEQLAAIESYDDRWETSGHDFARAHAAALREYLAGIDALRAKGVEDCFAESAPLRRAEIARLRGEMPLALAALGQYFQTGGECALAYRSLGEVLMAAHEKEGARDAFERARAAGPGLPGVRLGLARIAAADGNADDALTLLQQEIALDPETPDAYLEGGLVHDRLRGDREAAQQWFERYRAHGGDPQVLAGRLASWRRQAGETP